MNTLEGLHFSILEVNNCEQTVRCLAESTLAIRAC
jgi:hypothetical protein